MELARIAELLEPYLAPAKDQRLTTNDLQDISTYIDILMRWNARINLTAIRSEEEIVTRHFGESLFAARHLFPLRSAVSSVGTGFEVADVGSGAGFPGIPFKLWAPSIKLTLIESNQRKATFLREVARTLTLTNINILSVRAETLPHATFNLVTLRAVEHFESILPIASRLVAPRGRLALLIGQSQLEKVEAVLPDLRWEAPIAIPESNARILRIGSIGT